MASIVLRGIEKAYASGATVVSGMELTIQDGEFLTLVGPSGCGKSTTLNIIAGLEAPSQGKVLIDGQDVTALDPKDRDVAMVFQSYALYPHLDVAGNIAFPLKARGVPSHDRTQRVKETAERLGLSGLLSRKPRELSGGQRQRVALARALVRRPKVFLFDEPLSNLDATLRLQMRAELKALHHELKATFVYVTHDQAEAMTLSDRVAVLHQGRLQHVAPPLEVYDQPANLFVAGFVGSPPINVVRPESLGLSPNPDVVAAIRPDHVTVSPAETGGWTVYVVEPMGAVTWVTLTRGEERIIAKTAADFSARPGSPASLEFDTHRVLFFNAMTGAREQRE